MNYETKLGDIMYKTLRVIEFEELQALRAWKEKARPFLNMTLNQLKDIPIPNLVDQQNIKALTELLGGEDE